MNDSDPTTSLLPQSIKIILYNNLLMSNLPPKSHPRYHSLMLRERIVEGLESGILAKEGLIAHGRGEAFDYLIGEMTIPQAEKAERITAYHLLLAEHPVLSVNGNVAVLAPEHIIALSKLIDAQVEVNLFYRTEERVRKIVSHLEDHGGQDILGQSPDAEIPGLDHARALCAKDGIFKADVVLVPLEDGDRTKALKEMGKTVITIDLNPFSRTSQTADITIVDNVVRAIPEIINHIERIRGKNEGREAWMRAVEAFDNQENLSEVLVYINDRLQG